MRGVSIRKKLLYLIIFFVVIPMFLVPVLTYNRYESILKDKINITTQQMLSQTSNNMDNAIENMIAASNMLCLDKELIDILQKENDNNVWDKHINDTKVAGKIANAQIATLYPYNSYIAVIDFNNNMYYSYSYPIDGSYNEIVSEKWFKKTVDMNGYMLWMAPAYKYMNSGEENRNDIVMSRLIMDENSKKSCGVIVIRLEKDMKLNSFMNSDSGVKGAKLFLVNEENDIVLSSTNEEKDKVLSDILAADQISQSGKGSFGKKVDNVNFVVNYYTVQKTGWKFVQIIPYDNLMKEVDGLRNFNYLTNMVFVLLFIVITYIISWGITNPLHRLSILMKKVPDGNFNIRANIRGNDEVASLGRSFNIMVEEIDSLITKLKYEYELREKLRLEALQAQINPHFLLNTLNGIKWMANINGDVDVGNTIASLGYLLETTIGKNEEMITLSQEIKCIDSYVLLQRMRYGDKFNIEYDIDEKLLQYKVPCLLLQPIVENSIIHGLRDRDNGGLITVTVKSESGNVIIEVKDNGRGMGSGMLERILQEDNLQSGRFSNIGVKNVNERIKLTYGQQYGINIVSRENWGTIVSMKLPEKEVG